MSLLASSSLLAFLTIMILLLIIQSHAITLLHKIPANHDLRSKDCAFEFSGQRYDLCPLFRGGARKSVDAGVVYGEARRWRIAYELVFAGGMDREPTDSEPSCPEVAWVCMTAVIDWSSDEVENNDPSWVLTAVGRRRVVTTDAEVVASLATGEGDHSLITTIVLHLNGGVGDSMLWQSARIAFQCSLEGDDDLRFVGDRGGIHSFLWITQYGCSVEQRSSAKAILQLLSAEDGIDDTSPAAEEDKEGEEMLKPNPRLNKIRGWTVVVFLLVVFAVTCASALAVSPRALNMADERLHAPVISRVVVVLEPLQKLLGVFSPTSLYHFGLRFRRKDSRLDQWVQEEMSLEEDIMVNGASTYDGYGIPENRWNADDFGEDIPLTTSPKWRPAVRRYGSIPAAQNLDPQAPTTVGGMTRFFHF